MGVDYIVIISMHIVAIMSSFRNMPLNRLMYFLFVGPAVCFMQDQAGLHREPHVRYAATSAVVAPIRPSGPCTIVDFTMREAQNFDTKIVVSFLDQLRTFHDSLHDGDTAQSTTPLIKDGDTIQSLMPQIRNCHVVLAQPTIIGETESACSEPIGFASYHLRYTGFGPPLLHMEHLFVNPNCRSQGAGLALMNELANIGKQYHCSHMEWSVHKENVRGVQFYHRIGAVTLVVNDAQPKVVDLIKNTPKKLINSHDETSSTMKWIPATWNL
jgi:Acetyltransferase (GNAT) family